MNMYSSSSKSNNKHRLPKELSEAFDQEPQQLGKELERVWELTGITLTGDTSSSKEDTDEMWARLQSSIDAPNKRKSLNNRNRIIQDRPPTQRRVASPRLKAKWLAPIMASVLAFAFYWYVPVTIKADRGEITQVFLPDGSEVTLNSGSTLSYKRGFDGMPFVDAKQRLVYLDGEGYFDVTHSDASFTVNTFNAKVQVLGTEFNVRSWPNEPELESSISLMSGRVAVYKAGASETPVILEEKGQMAVVLSSEDLPELPETVDIESVLSWRERGLLIKSKTLETVFGELERRYDVTISVEDQQILNDSLTMLFAKPEGIESILNGICIERNLKFRRTSRGYVIYRHGS